MSKLTLKEYFTLPIEWKSEEEYKKRGASVSKAVKKKKLTNQK